MTTAIVTVEQHHAQFQRQWDTEYHGTFYRTAQLDIVELKKKKSGKWKKLNWHDKHKAMPKAHSDPAFVSISGLKHMYFKSPEGGFVIVDIPNEKYVVLKPNIAIDSNLIILKGLKSNPIVFRAADGQIYMGELSGTTLKQGMVNLHLLMLGKPQSAKGDIAAVMSADQSTVSIYWWGKDDDAIHYTSFNLTKEVFNMGGNLYKYANGTKSAIHPRVEWDRRLMWSRQPHPRIIWTSQDRSKVYLNDSCYTMNPVCAPWHSPAVCTIPVKGNIFIVYVAVNGNLYIIDCSYSTPAHLIPCQKVAAVGNVFASIAADSSLVIHHQGSDKKIYEITIPDPKGDIKDPKGSFLNALKQATVKDLFEETARKGFTAPAALCNPNSLMISKFASPSAFITFIRETVTRGNSFSLSVFRPDILRESIMTYPEHLKTPLYPFSFTWKKEASSGPGPTREWLTCLFQEITNPELGLFKTKKDGTVFLSPFIDQKWRAFASATEVATSVKEGKQEVTSGTQIKELLKVIPKDHEKNPEMFVLEYFGFMLAKVLSTDSVAGVNLNPFFFRLLRDEKVTWEDSKEISASFHRSCNYIAQNKITDDDELVFSFPIKKLTPEGTKKIEIVKLCNKPDNEPVTEANKKEYLQAKFKSKYVDRYQPYIKAIQKGFFSVFPRFLLAEMDHTTLQEVICGKQLLDFETIKKHISAPGDSSTKDAQDHFWKTLQTCTPEQLKKFLYFISGTSHIPANFDALGQKLYIYFTTSKNRAPTASTCGYSGTFSVCDSIERFQKLFHFAIDGAHFGYDQSY